MKMSHFKIPATKLKSLIKFASNQNHDDVMIAQGINMVMREGGEKSKNISLSRAL